MEGVKYLHEHKVCHRDIKPDNIMLTKDHKTLKLLDFNVSKRFSDRPMMTVTGVENWQAPEMLQNQPYTQKVDMWSVGCCVYFMLTSKQPFKSNNIAKLHQNIINAKYDTNNDDYLKVSRSGKDFIHNLLQANPDLRFSVNDALEHYWFKEIEVDPLDS